MIRLATEEDFEKILDMSCEFWQYTQFKDEPFEREHTLTMVNMSFDHGLLAAVEIDGECVGFCAGVKSYTLASTQALCASELAYWINPQHRGGKNGKALLHFMEELVKEQKIKYWTMVAMESSMPELMGAMYEKEGYVRSETGFTKVFHHGVCSGGSGSSGGCNSLLS